MANAAEKTELATTQQGTGIMAVIERMANNPDFPVEKLERMLDMQERILAKQAESDFNAAMTAAQSEMTRISADANNPQTKSKYASYHQLDKHLRPIYTKHGFALSFDEGEPPGPDMVRVLCIVSHVGGHSRTYGRNMPADGKGAKGGDVMTKTHASGAAQSYGMRYLLKGIFNVAVGEDDKDGNGTAKINSRQLEHLETLITQAGADRKALLETLGVEKLEDLPAQSFKIATVALNAAAKVKGKTK